MKFNIGDKIVYPLQGAGVISSIESRTVIGEKKDYYVLKISVGNMNVLVPCDKAEEIGVRYVMSEDEADKVIEYFKKTDILYDANWNKRYRENLERIKSGNIYYIAEVFKGLLKREKERGLSTGERKMLTSAKQIIISELILAKKMSGDEILHIFESAI